ncbi:hypothetical protein HMPREF0972_01345 [Actinomyces sp. oral taxon 848 str. F0332]|nr:hypothetical protein HMPREF0972_01345 [Actinomyces sp. oral taxon 848 str. F0332]
MSSPVFSLARSAGATSAPTASATDAASTQPQRQTCGLIAG